MMGLAGLLGTVELKSRWSVCLWLFVPPEVAHLHADQLGSVREWSTPLSGLSSFTKDRRATQKGIEGGAVRHGERRKVRVTRKMIVISREDHSACLQKGVAIELATAPKGVLLEKQLQLHTSAKTKLVAHRKKPLLTRPQYTGSPFTKF